MRYTILPVISRDPVTFGAEYLPLDDAEGEAWKQAMQKVHPRLLPQVKESALVAEEESEFCLAGGIFEYVRGQELVLDGVEYTLSHCGEHFLDALQTSAQCLALVREQEGVVAAIQDTEQRQERLAQLLDWWQRGFDVMLLQH
ncbi:MAG TPA: hypothetical protein VFV52_05695 [Bacilli bacterium]|nr:hypothetical protein [Bacilli bacterium]